MKETNWDIEFYYKDVNEMYNYLCTKILGLTKKYVPVVSLNKKANIPPWERNVPARIVKTRAKCWKEYKRLRTSHGRNSAESLQALYNYNQENKYYESYIINKRVQ